MSFPYETKRNNDYEDEDSVLTLYTDDYLGKVVADCFRRKIDCHFHITMLFHFYEIVSLFCKSCIGAMGTKDL